MTPLSNFVPHCQTASRQQCDELIKQILSKSHEDRSSQARAILKEEGFYIYEGDLWIDDDIVINRWIIITGDLIVNGNCYDSEGVLLVLGDMRCAHMFSEYGICVWGDLICGGLSYNYYNDWCLEVVGALSARAIVKYDKCVQAGTMLTDEQGDIVDGDADAVCGLLGFRGERCTDEEEDEDDDIAMETARRRIEEIKTEKGTYIDLEGLELTELPDEIFELTWLESLCLSDNQLTAIPESISRLQKLTELDLSYNKLMSLPDEVGLLRNLTDLYLRDNLLARIPETIGQLSDLETLDIGKNRLTSLPDTIGRLKKLRELDVSDNRLSVLPVTTCQLEGIELLGLMGNPLRNLPDAIGNVSTSKERKQEAEQYALTLESEQPQAAKLQHEASRVEILEAFPQDIWKIIGARQAQGHDAFVVPFPSMEDLVNRWGEDWAWRKRLWYPHRAGLELSPKEQRHLAAKGSEWLFELIVSKNLASDAFAEYLHHEDERVRWALAASPDCPKVCLKMLAKDPKATVRNAVANNINCPPDTRSTQQNDAD